MRRRLSRSPSSVGSDRDTPASLEDAVDARGSAALRALASDVGPGGHSEDAVSDDEEVDLLLRLDDAASVPSPVAAPTRSKSSVSWRSMALVAVIVAGAAVGLWVRPSTTAAGVLPRRRVASPVP
jgi:hypothetical protein